MSNTSKVTTNRLVWAQRLLLAAMLVVVWMLVVAWNKDHPKHTANANTTASATAAAVSASDAPSSASATGDVPAAISTLPAVTTADPSVPALNDANLITVQTDLYDIQIDRQGGDVVGLSLNDIADSLDDPQPLRLLNQGNGLTYVAQSGLIGVNGIDAGAVRPLFSSPQASYTLASDADVLSVPLHLVDANGVSITKTYTFKRGEYPINMAYTINNTSAQPWQAQLFTQLKRDGSPDPSKTSQGIGGIATFIGAAWGTPDSQFNKIKLKKIGEAALNQPATDGYIAMIQHYFVSAWIPSKGQNSTITTRSNKGDYIVSMLDQPFSVAANATQTVSSTLYAGPKDQKILKGLAKGLDQTVDYGWLWPLAKIMYAGLAFFHSVVGNWGWAIVMLTITAKLILWPLSAKSYRSMAKMKVIAPKMTEMKERFGDDKAGFAQAMMKMYKDEKVNPLSGCMPMLLQMPVFLSLYWVLMESVELRHAPWLLWIHDLSSMDQWFILPLIMGATMFMQQMLNPQPADPMQAKVLRLMPIIFTGFMLFFPAGLVLYWVVNNMVSVAQQWYITRQIEKTTAA